MAAHGNGITIRCYGTYDVRIMPACLGTLSRTKLEYVTVITSMGPVQPPLAAQAMPLYVAVIRSTSPCLTFGPQPSSRVSQSCCAPLKVRHLHHTLAAALQQPQQYLMLCSQGMLH